MKIVATSAGETLDSLVDPRFGRAAKFVLIDTESGETKAVDNTQNMNAAQGAGIQAAQTVSRLGAKAVLTGHCGPRAFQVLQGAGIKVIVGVTGRISQAVEDFKAGRLKPADSADVEGHWA